MTTLRNENIELGESYSTLQRTHAQALATHQAEISTLTRRCAELEQELVGYRGIAEERDATIQALQQKLDETEVASDPMLRKRNEDENWGVIRDELHRQASYLRSLETTNAKLNAELGRYKDRHSNLEVLREEKRTLERKVLVVDELREKVVSLEAQVEAARRERQEWYAVYSRPKTTCLSDDTGRTSLMRLARPPNLRCPSSRASPNSDSRTHVYLRNMVLTWLFSGVAKLNSHA